MNRAWRLLGWPVALLALALATLRAVREPLGAPAATPANLDLTPAQDFRDATYYPLRELLAGGDPYEPTAMLGHWPVRQEFDLYTPLHLTLHLPLAWLSYVDARAVFIWLTLACVVAVGVVAARLAPPAPIPGGWPAALTVGAAVLAGQYGKATVYTGQIDGLVGLGAVVALLLQGRPGRSAHWWAAAGLAVAWIKPQFGIPLALLLLARGAWRQAAWGTAVAAALSLPVVAVLVARAGGVAGFVSVLRRNLEFAAQTPYGRVDALTGARVDLAAVGYRVFGALPPAAELAALVAVLVPVGWLLARRRGQAFDIVELALTGVAVLLCITHQPCELITVPAAVAVLGAWLRGERPGWGSTVLGGLLVIPALHISAVQNVIAARLGERADSLVEGGSLVLTLLLALGLAWRSLRPEPQPSAARPAVA